MGKVHSVNCTSANWLQNFLYLRTLITDNTLSQQLAIILNCISANGALLQDYTEWEGEVTTSTVKLTKCLQSTPAPLSPLTTPLCSQERPLIVKGTAPHRAIVKGSPLPPHTVTVKIRPSTVKLEKPTTRVTRVNFLEKSHSQC